MTDVLSMTEALDAETLATRRRDQVPQSLQRRNRAEKVFRGLGLAACLAAVSFVAALFGNILYKGLPAFWQVNYTAEVYFDPEILRIDARPVQRPGQTPADYLRELQTWQRQLAMLNWNRLIAASVQGSVGAEIDDRSAISIIDPGARFVLRDMVDADPSLIGQRRTVTLLGSANADNWAKGKLSRDLPDERQQLSRAARDAIDTLEARGVMSQRFAWHLFTNVDSRSAPASAGLAGAFMGSLYMMLIVVLLAVPIGVASAI